MTAFHIPIRLPSLANSRIHWRAMDKLKRSQREAVFYAMYGLELPPLPVVVTITRSGPQTLDDDNLQSACKYVRDQIAAAFKEDDGSAAYTWRYAQRKSKAYGVDVEIMKRLL